MRQVCDEADAGAYVLILTPVPADDAIGVEQLIRFYRRFGFEVTQESPVLMIRPPVGFDPAAQVMPQESNTVTFASEAANGA